ncbi:hypothetical protein PHYBOEH_002446 [Phytophthora boehmeriae]|uniref:RxLR effector protein n=1 Tax=Phytophthora boehmeriae TaxID=109152 RepID=A0A8T1WWZ5_9STRA|nr:hypothetical protein PHYBOEH_002446 [Phytophthora boehmeriae]
MATTAILSTHNIAAVSIMADSDAVKPSDEVSPHGHKLVGSLRGVEKADKDHTPTKVSSREDGEERVVSKAELVSALRISEGEAKVLRGILKGRAPEHILTKLNAPFEYVNGIKVYPKNSPEYKMYLFLVKYARNDLPYSMFHRS